MDYSDEEFDKVVGQFRGQLNGIMLPLRMYGQGSYCDGVIKEIESLAVQMHMKLAGLDIPYHVNHELLHW